MEKSNYLQSLETKVDALIHLCQKLAGENNTLRESQTHLMSERAALLEKNALARTRIEAMVTRLKSMEVSK
jgi:cell division protein ZapB